MNSLKHGNRSRKVALLREESCAFEERLRKWMAIGGAQNDVEEYLVYRNVCLSFELDRTERARLERCASLIEKSDEEEVTQAQAVGWQLFFDPTGPTPLYGNRTFFPSKKKTSWNGEAVDPNDPAVLVKILESNAAGCCQLRDEWKALRSQLESPVFWQSHDRLKAIRLLGRQPVEANDDRRVATIFVASHALWPSGKTEFDDLLSDMEDVQRTRYRKAVRERWPDLFRTREKAEWKQMLLDLADQNIERLNAKLEVHEQNADAQAERTFALLCFDHSPEGEALRNYLIKCTNGLFRGMANYRKYQAENKCRSAAAETDPPRRIYDPPGANGDFPASRSGPVPESHERDGLELQVDEAFGSEAGQDDRVEPAAVIDSDGVGPHGDLVSSMGEIGENAASEANFDETASSVELQDCIQVTANSGALSGLDIGVAEPGEGDTPEHGEALVDRQTSTDAGVPGRPAVFERAGSGDPRPTTTPEQGEAPGSGSESSGAKPPTTTSSDRARRRSSPAAVSKRQKGRSRRETQRQAIERMVEEKLTSGNYVPGEILMTALTMPLPGRRGP